MKNLLLAVFTIALFTTANAQVSIVMTNPTPGSTIVANSFNPTVTITNSGSTAIPAGDTIFYWINTGTSTTPLSFGGTVGAWSIEILSAPMAAGATISKTCVTYSFSTPTTTPTLVPVCAKAGIGLAGAQAASPASSCYTINRSLASVNEITLEEITKIFVANGILNMSSTSTDNLTYTVVSITGQVVSQGTFNSNKQIDLNGVAKGIYAIVITNGKEKVTKKVAVQ